MSISSCNNHFASTCQKGPWILATAFSSEFLEGLLPFFPSAWGIFVAAVVLLVILLIFRKVNTFSSVFRHLQLFCIPIYLMPSAICSPPVLLTEALRPVISFGELSICDNFSSRRTFTEIFPSFLHFLAKPRVIFELLVQVATCFLCASRHYPGAVMRGCLALPCLYFDSL